MKVAIYARVSTGKQELDNQLIQLRAYCVREGYEVYKEYTEVISGANIKRKAFDEVFKDAHRKLFNVVLFWDISRFSRSGTLFTLQKLKELENLGIDWHSYTEPYFTSIGHFKDVVLSVMATLAKVERIKISERTKAGLARAKEKGNFAGRPKKDRKIYSKFCIIKGCRVRIRFDNEFCKKHKPSSKGEYEQTMGRLLEPKQENEVLHDE